MRSTDLPMDVQGRHMSKTKKVKLVSGSELNSSTYGHFSKSGVTVDVHTFLKSSSGQTLMTQIREARTGRLVAKPSK